MPAFYALPRCLFYRHGAVHCGRFNIHFVRLHVRLEVKKIVHRMSEILFAAEIPFRSGQRHARVRTESAQAHRRCCGTTSRTFVASHAQAVRAKGENNRVNPIDRSGECLRAGNISGDHLHLFGELSCFSRVTHQRAHGVSLFKCHVDNVSPDAARSANHPNTVFFRSLIISSLYLPTHCKAQLRR